MHTVTFIMSYYDIEDIRSDILSLNQIFQSKPNRIFSIAFSVHPPPDSVVYPSHPVNPFFNHNSGLWKYVCFALSQNTHTFLHNCTFTSIWSGYSIDYCGCSVATNLKSYQMPVYSITFPPPSVQRNRSIRFLFLSHPVPFTLYLLHANIWYRYVRCVLEQ